MSGEPGIFGYRYRLWILILFVWAAQSSLGLLGADAQIARNTVLQPYLDRLLPSTISKRQADLQAQIDAIERSELPPDELEPARAPLVQLSQQLAALEEAQQRRITYQDQLAQLPLHLQEANTQYTELTTAPPRQFPHVTEQIRDAYESQLEMALGNMQELYVQISADGVRLTAIAQEIAERVRLRPIVEQQLIEASSQPSKPDGPQQSVLRVDQLNVQLQRLKAELETLEIERQLLTKRAALHNARLRLAKAQQETLRRDLYTIKRVLSEAFEDEQNAMSSEATRIDVE